MAGTLAQAAISLGRRSSALLPLVRSQRGQRGPSERRVSGRPSTQEPGAALDLPQRRGQQSHRRCAETTSQCPLLLL